MVGRPARRLGLDPVKPQIGEIERINERVDHANSIAFVDPVFEAFRQQRCLRAFRPRNEALHQCPRRFNRRIIASVEFSHSQGHGETSKLVKAKQLIVRLSLARQRVTQHDPHDPV